MRAIVAREIDGRTRGALEDIDPAALPAGDVLVDVSHSTLSYKDGLAITGKGKICRNLPMIGGIDLAGTVRESRDARWKPGDRVLVNGYGLSERHWGGLAEQASLQAGWLVRLPEAFGAEEGMAIGTAGYTAMLCVQAILDHGTRPDDGPVLVTGAAGGVGSVAVMLLASLGYRVTAGTGRVAETETFLRGLGASDLLGREALARDTKALEAETWAAVVDTVGDKVLATALAQTRYEGIVTACGLAGGAGLPSSVMPFILRGVTLRGIDSVMASQPRRQAAWEALARLVDRARLRAIYRVEPLDAVPALAAELIAGRVRGRIVIDVRA
ncbi:MAG: MDR family oxidoreductase [Gammaproteobacteria bacterium]